MSNLSEDLTELSTSLNERLRRLQEKLDARVHNFAIHRQEYTSNGTIPEKAMGASVIVLSPSFCGAENGNYNEPTPPPKPFLGEQRAILQDAGRPPRTLDLPTPLSTIKKSSEKTTKSSIDLNAAHTLKAGSIIRQIEEKVEMQPSGNPIRSQKMARINQMLEEHRKNKKVTTESSKRSSVEVFCEPAVEEVHSKQQQSGWESNDERDHAAFFETFNKKNQLPEPTPVRKPAPVQNNYAIVHGIHAEDMPQPAHMTVDVHEPKGVRYLRPEHIHQPIAEPELFDFDQGDIHLVEDEMVHGFRDNEPRIEHSNRMKNSAQKSQRSFDISRISGVSMEEKLARYNMRRESNADKLKKEGLKKELENVRDAPEISRSSNNLARNTKAYKQHPYIVERLAEFQKQKEV